MKLYVVVGRVNRLVAFVNEAAVGDHPIVPNLYTSDDGKWLITAFESAGDAAMMHDNMIHAQAKLCKVVEIEIPDEE